MISTSKLGWNQGICVPICRYGMRWDDMGWLLITSWVGWWHPWHPWSMMLVARGKRCRRCKSLILAMTCSSKFQTPEKNAVLIIPFLTSPFVRAPNLWPAPMLPKSVLTGEAAISELTPGVVLVGPRCGRVTRLVPHAPWWYDLRLFQWPPIFSPIRFLAT